MTNIWGTPRGYIDVRPSEGTAQNTCQAQFKVFYDACERWVAVGYAEQVALNYGDNATYANPLGIDFHDGANPFGSNAWVTYKFPATHLRPWSYYVHAQWSSGAGNFGTTPGDPALIQATTGASSAAFGIQFALAVDANLNSTDAWNGTTNFDGSDTKGSTLWIAPAGGTVHVFPRSNNPGGDHADLKQNFIGIQDNTYTANRLHYLHDGDHFMTWFDANDNGWPTGIGIDYTYFGMYKPDPTIPRCVPFVCVHDNTDQPGTNSGTGANGAGDLTGTAFRNGGILSDVNIGVDNVVLGISFGAGSDWTNRTTPEHDIGTETGRPAYPIYLAQQPAGGSVPQLYGLVGETYSRKWGYLDANTMAQHDVFPASTPYEGMAYTFDVATTPAWRQIFMYGGTQHPGTTSTRQGVLV